MTSHIRRLPVYLVVDTSESMVGEPFRAVTTGITTLIHELRGEPMALESAFISLITFASRASQEIPLTDLLQCQLPELTMGSGTALGAALDLTRESIARDVRRGSETAKGDWKPLVFLMTDGTPTDSWRSAAQRFRRELVDTGNVNLIGVACGPHADASILRQLTGTVLNLKDTSEVSFKSFFEWVSASISTTSRKLQGSEGEQVGLPSLPEGATIAEEGAAASQETHAYFHMKCGRTKDFVVVVLEQEGRTYRPIGSYAVPKFDLASTGSGESRLDTSDIPHQIHCPSCRADGIAMCECGKVSCANEEDFDGLWTCAWCGSQGELVRGDFEADRGRG